MELLLKYANEFGIQINNKQLEQFETYLRMLTEKNKVMNLTAITDPEEIQVKHFLDSISIAIDYRFTDGIYTADLGTGAGFPGIPLKIVYPGIKMVLIDSLKKRLVFLDEVIEALDLNDIETFHGRAEDVCHNQKYREKFDLCVSRAVSSMPVLCEYCLPLVKKGGVFVAYKSGHAAQEIDSAGKAITILGGKISKQDNFVLPNTDIERTIVIIQKVKQTPEKYPRKAGVPIKQPL